MTEAEFTIAMARLSSDLLHLGSSVSRLRDVAPELRSYESSLLVTRFGGLMGSVQEIRKLCRKDIPNAAP